MRETMDSTEDNERLARGHYKKVVDPGAVHVR